LTCPNIETLSLPMKYYKEALSITREVKFQEGQGVTLQATQIVEQMLHEFK